jgi:hypothetical protein
MLMAAGLLSCARKEGITQMKKKKKIDRQYDAKCQNWQTRLYSKKRERERDSIKHRRTGSVRRKAGRDWTARDGTGE